MSATTTKKKAAAKKRASTKKRASAIIKDGDVEAARKMILVANEKEQIQCRQEVDAVLNKYGYIISISWAFIGTGLEAKVVAAPMVVKRKD